LTRRTERFRPADKKAVTVFTCGPSVYQRAHIGNFRTFLFEDILVRYLEYSGYAVRRGMNFTDIEEKTISEAEKQKTPLKALTERNIQGFIREMKCLRMKMPDYLPRASESVYEAVEIIECLLDRGIAYRHRGNVYFDPLKVPGFGQLYGIDMKRWPSKKRRFHKDTYPGVQWNLGDFVLWHGFKKGDKHFWDTRIGRGRPSWNIQDPGMVGKHFHATLSLYCGGIDNLYRHHDYTKAILESVRPYPMAKYWLHCQHLLVNGKKMSKSKGNVLYTEDLQRLGYSMAETRFYLTYGHYREMLNFSEKQICATVNRLRHFRELIRTIRNQKGTDADNRGETAQRLKKTFEGHMDNDLNLGKAFDGLYEVLSGVYHEAAKPDEAAGIVRTLQEIDRVFNVFFTHKNPCRDQTI
jgi:cysteinyl-tRNA synthetase